MLSATGAFRLALTRVVVVLSLAVLPVYVTWRLLWSSSGAFAPLYLVVLIVEIASIVRFLAKVLPVFVAPSGDWEAGEVADAQADILIVAAAEPLLLVRTAVQAAVRVHGRCQVIVHDTVGREDLARYCKTVGVRLTTDPAAALAGNAEHVLLVPASLFVHPNILKICTPAFTTSRTAAVTGEVRVDRLGELVGASGYLLAADIDAPFSRLIDRFGLTTPLHGPLLCRRDALEAAAPNEWRADRFLLEVGVAFQRAGLRIRPSLSPVASRRMSWREESALRTRARLSNGRMQVTRRENLRGLSRRQRCVYSLAKMELFVSAATVVGFAVPTVCAFTGFVPLTATFRSIALVAAPWLLLSGLARRLVDRSGEPIGSHLRRVARTAVVDLRVLGEHAAPVSSATQAANIQASTAMVLFGLSVSAALLPFSGFALNPLPKLAGALVLVASLVLLWLARDVYLAIEDRQHRAMARLEMMSSTTVADATVEVLTVSPLGFDVVAAEPLGLGDRLVVSCAIPEADGSWHEQTVSASVRRVAGPKPGDRVYVEFAADEQLFDRLLYYVSVSAPELDRRGLDAPIIEQVRRWSETDDVVELGSAITLDLCWLHDEISRPLASTLR